MNKMMTSGADGVLERRVHRMGARKQRQILHRAREIHPTPIPLR